MGKYLFTDTIKSGSGVVQLCRGGRGVVGGLAVSGLIDNTSEIQFQCL